MNKKSPLLPCPVDAQPGTPIDPLRRTFVSLPLLLAGSGGWAQNAVMPAASAPDAAGATAPAAPVAEPAPPAAAASSAAAAAPVADAPNEFSATRLALLIGNRVYPPPFDLPPVHKNIRDLSAVLTKRGFEVTALLDENPAAQRAAIASFAKLAQAAPPDATILFYFTGHGTQVDAENLMLGAGVPPNERESALISGSLHLKRDVVDQLPRRATGLSIAVVDACRESVTAALKAGGGLNQVEAPLGCMIVFSTGAGRPAIAPNDEKQNTFYTASLVKLLETSTDELSFSDLFRLVKFDVQQVMQNHPLQGIRALAQSPFIAENTQVRFRLAPRPKAPAAVAPPVYNVEEEKALLQELESSTWPNDVVRLADEYLKRYPTSKIAGSALVAREGAGDAVRVLRSNEVRLYKSAFQLKTAQANWQADLRKAARGDKDAAARIARAHLQGEGGITADGNRYEGWMQYASALGNGIACYELAVHYRRQGQPVPAAQYEARAKDLGYTPPATLDNVRK